MIDVRRTSSARKRYGPTGLACARTARPAARLRSASTGYGSFIIIRSAAAGGCSGKKRIASPRQKRLPEALSDDQVRHLLGCVRSPTHRTCLAIVYACGLRISEAATLEVGAIDRANKVLRIIGKGNKERLVPLPQPILDELGHLWRSHHNPRWLFPNRRGDAPLNTSLVADPFTAAVVAAGIRRDVTPHTLRHSYATRLIENGVDIRVVQILLGHASIASTAIYPHLTTPTRASLHTLLDRLMTGLGGTVMIEVADVFRRFVADDLSAHGASMPPSAARSGAAKRATARCSPTTPATIAAARSATPPRHKSGSNAVRRRCCRCPTSTSLSPCRRNCARNCAPISAPAMAC